MVFVLSGLIITLVWWLEFMRDVEVEERPILRRVRAQYPNFAYCVTCGDRPVMLDRHGRCPHCLTEHWYRAGGRSIEWAWKKSA